MDNVLVLVRHGQSEWNKKNLFTGWKDVDLTKKGKEQARLAGELLKQEGIHFDVAYTSRLIRAQKTLDIMLDVLGQPDLTTIENEALNERDYGALAGLNKDEAKAKFGKQQVKIWRRSYDIPPPEGESLKDTADRVLPYYTDVILPDILAGKNVLVSGHGNALRALSMRLDGLSPDQVIKLSIANAVPLIYRIKEDGSASDKWDLTAAAA